jgi:hypothetical protein
MAQPTELVNLLLVIVVAPVLYRFSRSERFEHMRYFAVAYVLLAFEDVATVIEGYAHPDFFNSVEHALLAGCGIFFAAGVISMARAARRGELR